MLVNSQSALIACVAALGLVGAAIASPADRLTEAQRTELAVFGMRAMGLKVTPKDVKKTPSPAETLQLVATGLNLNGHLCATVADISPLNVKSGYEVTCIANRGGSARKTYVVDSLAGKASEL